MRVIDNLDYDLPEDEELTNLNDEFGQLLQQDQYMQAINIGKRICEIYRTRYGQEIFSRYSGMYSLSLNNLANVYVFAHDYLNAESIFVAKLEFLANVVGKNSSDYAYTLADLASLYYSAGDDNRSQSLYRNAFEILDGLEEKDSQIYEKILNEYQNRFSH